MTASDSPTYQCDRCPDSDIIEAFEDFQSLQMLTASLIFRILSTRHELEERLHAEDDLPAIDAFRLRHADEYVFLQNPPDCFRRFVLEMLMGILGIGFSWRSRK